MSTEPTFLSQFPVCGCGNMQEAHDAALRACCQMAEHDCLSWYVAVVISHINILAYMSSVRPELDFMRKRNDAILDLMPDDATQLLWAQIDAALEKATGGAMN